MRWDSKRARAVMTTVNDGWLTLPLLAAGPSTAHNIEPPVGLLKACLPSILRKRGLGGSKQPVQKLGKGKAGVCVGAFPS